MRILAVCLTGCILDVVFGDPYWLYHPVRLIGALIAKCEQICRQIANEIKMASVDRRRCDLCRCPACFRGSSGGDSVSGVEDPPASFVWSGKLLVLPDPGGEVASDREYESLSGIEKTRSSGGATGGFHDRGTGYGESGCRGSDKGGGGDRRGEYVRRRDRAASVFADRRRAPWICLQGGQHDGFDAWI